MLRVARSVVTERPREFCRVLLEKLGFALEGQLRSYFKLGDERVDHLLYSMLRSDYLPL